MCVFKTQFNFNFDFNQYLNVLQKLIVFRLSCFVWSIIIAYRSWSSHRHKFRSRIIRSGRRDHKVAPIPFNDTQLYSEFVKNATNFPRLSCYSIGLDIRCFQRLINKNPHVTYIDFIAVICYERTVHLASFILHQNENHFLSSVCCLSFCCCCLVGTLFLYIFCF